MKTFSCSLPVLSAGYLSQYKICLLPGFRKHPAHQKRQIKEDTSLQLHWLLPREKRWCCWPVEVLCKKVTQFLGTKKFDSPMEDGSSCLLLYMWASSTMFSFSVWSGKEVSLDCISKISQGTGEVTKIVSVLVLSCTSISEFMHVLNNAFRVLKMLWYRLLDVKDRVMILCHIIRNDKQMLFTDYRFLLCTLNTIHFFIWVPVENGDMETDFVDVKIFRLYFILGTASIMLRIVVNTDSMIKRKVFKERI